MNELQKITTFEEDIAVIKDITTKSFLITGKILSNIQADKKYKTVGYKTFSDAIETELGLKRAHAYRLIEAARTYELLSPQGDILPTEETQIRYLTKLPDDEKVEVWQEVAKDRVPTAKEVKQAVDRRLGKNNSTKKKASTPAVDDYILLQEKYNQAQKRIEELVKSVNDLLPFADKIVELEEELRLLKESCVAPAEILIEQAEVSTLIPRQMVFEFIQKNGTEFQVMALKDESLPNEKLWKVFLKVREQYKASTPPPAWDKVIVNATGIE